jgi:hypothetical protein
MFDVRCSTFDVRCSFFPVDTGQKQLSAYGGFTQPLFRHYGLDPESMFIGTRRRKTIPEGAEYLVAERKPRFFGKKFEIRISKSETMTKTEMFQ